MQGRKFICKNYSKGVGYFDFEELCDQPVGAADFIAIARICPTILIKNIPVFTIDNRNILRRFIVLVFKFNIQIDELYNHNVKLYCMGASRLDKLFKKDDDASSYDEVFAFDRTLSRLKEMQSDYYFQKSHLYHKEEEKK